MKILIVGGGIGGLAAASFLERKGFEVTLVEQAPEFKHIGFGMTVFSPGRRMLHELGVDEEVAKKGHELPWMEMATVSGHILGGRINCHDLRKFGEPIITVERANLHDALVQNVKKTKILLGTTWKEIKSEKDKVHVEFSDNSKHTFDLLIAADGIRSKIRDEFFGSNQSSFYGWSLRFFWAPAHVPPPAGPIFLSKTRTTFAVSPIGEKCLVTMYESNPGRMDHMPLPIDSFLPYMKTHGWTEKYIEDITREAKEGHQFYDHLRHVKMGTWYKKRIVLLGDSRHGLSPVTGMSGTMALEDAYVLAEELSMVPPDEVPIALENYSRRRTRRVRKVINLSKFLERFYFINSPIQEAFRNSMVRIFPKKIFLKKLEAILGDTL